MLKVGVPRGGVKQKMRQDGVDPSVLDLDPDKPVPAKPSTTAEPPLNAHPRYAKVCMLDVV